MDKPPSIDELWDSVVVTERVFDPADVAALPETARRYLEHAIAPGTPLASAVRLKMHGDFRIKGWRPFTGEQVNRCDGEFLWRATMKLCGIPVRGFDSLVSGKGQMQWKLFGAVPLASGEGSDITRSAIGRLQGEVILAALSALRQGHRMDSPGRFQRARLLFGTWPENDPCPDCWKGWSVGAGAVPTLGQSGKR